MAVNSKLKGKVDSVLGTIGRLLLPPRCVLCEGRGHRGRDLCRACAEELPRNASCCARCALPLPVPAELCGLCLKRAPAFDAALVPYRYAYPLDRLLTRFKFGADLGVGRVLAELIGDAARRRVAPGTLVIPVPLHARRLAERGFNQAHELARLTAARLELELAPRALRRVRKTVAQTGLAADERRRNLRRAFEAADRVAGRAVVLLDDVVTTTATARECARALKRAGALRVELWAVARAGD